MEASYCTDLCKLWYCCRSRITDVSYGYLNTQTMAVDRRQSFVRIHRLGYRFMWSSYTNIGNRKTFLITVQGTERTTDKVVVNAYGMEPLRIFKRPKSHEMKIIRINLLHSRNKKKWSILHGTYEKMGTYLNMIVRKAIMFKTLVYRY